MTFAEKYSWTREQVNRMTIRDIKVHLMTKRELQSIGEAPRTKIGKKAIQGKVDDAVEHIMAGLHWNG